MPIRPAGECALRRSPVRHQNHTPGKGVPAEKCGMDGSGIGGVASSSGEPVSARQLIACVNGELRQRGLVRSPDRRHSLFFAADGEIIEASVTVRASPENTRDGC
ncbi:hypothetical protein [Hyphomicrobium sp. D-2]|uniref:hypothetical protein n=1 Tax=Hyphomicrobium sp. D-2 TaxID=3041621 RepID=UPI0024537926|nr:hypothetical protein [Hyphomicrobium sp. D-2]MDH4983028.1 hypothetical protein [Hyphomicrobium sp. D-2]